MARHTFVVAIAAVVSACGSTVGDDSTARAPSATPPPSSGPPPVSAPPGPPSHCSNARRDEDETAVDCGGSCPRCGDDEACSIDVDCRGGHCANGVCRSPVVDIAVGGSHTCALYGGGSVRCWGRSDRGQLGLGTREPRGNTPSTVPIELPTVALGKKRFAIALATGAASTCALLEGGALVCWGANVGPTGPGTNSDKGIYPEQMGDALGALDMGTGRTVRAVSCGMDHWCAVLDNAAVKCWGNDFEGRVGNGFEVPIAAMGDKRPALDLGTGRTGKAVLAGGSHTCAILDDMTLKCWGLNSGGQLGIGRAVHNVGTKASDMGDNLPRVLLGAGRTVKSIAIGLGHTCAILDDDTLKCWGSNVSGQLGLGDTLARGIDAAQMGDNLPAVQLGTGRKPLLVASSASATHTCVLLDDQTVRCFGWNASGQLGQGDVDDRGRTPSDVPALIAPVDLGGSVTKLAVGNRHVCAMLASGAVKCWGNNEHGQLGLGDTMTRGDEPAEMGVALPALALTKP